MRAWQLLIFAAMVCSVGNRPNLSDDPRIFSHREHNPDAALGRARRVLRGVDGLGRGAAAGGREGASIRGGRDGDRQADVDKARGGVGGVGGGIAGAGLKRARRPRPPAGVSGDGVVVV